MAKNAMTRARSSALATTDLAPLATLDGYDAQAMIDTTADHTVVSQIRPRWWSPTVEINGVVSRVAFQGFLIKRFEIKVEGEDVTCYLFQTTKPVICAKSKEDPEGEIVPAGSYVALSERWSLQPLAKLTPSGGMVNTVTLLPGKLVPVKRGEMWEIEVRTVATRATKEQNEIIANATEVDSLEFPPKDAGTPTAPANADDAAS